MNKIEEFVTTMPKNNNKIEFSNGFSDSGLGEGDGNATGAACSYNSGYGQADGEANGRSSRYGYGYGSANGNGELYGNKGNGSFNHYTYDN